MPLENLWRARKVRGSNLLLNREVGCESNLLSWICLTSLATFAEQHSNKLGKRNLKKMLLRNSTNSNV